MPSKGGAESRDNARFSKAALSRRLSASPPRNCGCCSSGLHSTSRRQKAESRKPSPTAQTWHSAKPHLRNEHSTINCETDEFDYDVRLPLDDLSDEDRSREADESWRVHRRSVLASVQQIESSNDDVSRRVALTPRVPNMPSTTRTARTRRIRYLATL